MTDSVAPQPGRLPSFAGPSTVSTRPPPPSDPVTTAVREFWGAHRTPAGVRTLVACGVVGVLAAVLVVDHQPGLGVAVAALLLWLPAVPTMLHRRAGWDLALAALSVALASVTAIRDAPWVVALSLVAAFVVALVAATGSRTVPAMLLSPLTAAFAGVRALPWLGAGLWSHVGSRRTQVLAVLRTLLVTAALLAVFGVLFATADAVFASYLPRVDAPDVPAQLVVALLVAAAAGAVLHLATAPPGWAGLRAPAARAARPVEWLVPVLALDVMVLAFLLVQLGSLVGGHGHVLETAGLTYAQYAREGFAQLVAATALTLVVVAVAARRAPRATAGQRVVTRVALGVLCLATVGVVASALRRMDLYVDAFGLTRLRLLAVAVEIGLAVVLVLVAAAGVRWRGGWLPRAVVAVGAATVLGLAAVNPDAQIVRYNAVTGPSDELDTTYLAGLSDDAVPAVAALDEPLRSCLLVGGPGQASVVEPSPDDDLGAWNLGRSRAREVLIDLPDDDAACP